MGPRLPRGLRERNVGPPRYPTVHDRHAKAWSEALWGWSAAVARELAIGDQQVSATERRLQRWGEPQEPTQSPTEAISRVLRAALELGADRAAALLPLHELARDLGARFVPDLDDAAEASIAEATGGLARECGEAVAVLAEAMGDGEIDDDERRAVLREIAEAREALAQAERSLQTRTGPATTGPKATGIGGAHDRQQA